MNGMIYIRGRERKKKEGGEGWLALSDFRLSWSGAGSAFLTLKTSCQSHTILRILSRYPVNSAKSWHPVEKSCSSVLEHPPGDSADMITEVEHIGAARNKIAMGTASRLFGDKSF